VLHTTDAIERGLVQRGLERADELRQQELDYLARATANDVAKSFS